MNVAVFQILIVADGERQRSSRSGGSARERIIEKDIGYAAGRACDGCAGSGLCAFRHRKNRIGNFSSPIDSVPAANNPFASYGRPVGEAEARPESLRLGCRRPRP